MVLSSTSCVTSCVKSCQARPKPNLVLFFKMEKKPVPCASPSMKWGIPSLPHPCHDDRQQHCQRHSHRHINQKRSKAINMQFCWIRDRVRQGLFQIYWSKGQTNPANYFSKHHPASHHQAIQSTYLYSPTNHARNYFECVSNTSAAPSKTVRSANSLTLTQYSVDPAGEGVLISPTCPCDVINDITKSHWCHISSSSFERPTHTYHHYILEGGRLPVQVPDNEYW